MTREFVSVKGLKVNFSHSEPVLENVFLNMKKGEFATVIGKSGVGKSTLLNSICGLCKYEGHVRKPEKVALVFQNYSLYPWMNIEHTVDQLGTLKAQNCIL